jgi:hypothetical protein
MATKWEVDHDRISRDRHNVVPGIWDWEQAGKPPGILRPPHSTCNAHIISKKELSEFFRPEIPR